MGIETIASMVIIAVDTLNRMLSKRAQAEGKSEGEVLRGALGPNKANDVLALQIISKAHALKGTGNKSVPSNLARMATLLDQLNQDAKGTS